MENSSSSRRTGTPTSFNLAREVARYTKRQRLVTRFGPDASAVEGIFLLPTREYFAEYRGASRKRCAVNYYDDDAKQLRILVLTPHALSRVLLRGSWIDRGDQWICRVERRNRYRRTVYRVSPVRSLDGDELSQINAMPIHDLEFLLPDFYLEVLA